MPGDKSVTHRALLLGAVAEGRTVVRGALDAGDTRSTAGCVQALGAELEWPGARPDRDRARGAGAPPGADPDGRGDPARTDPVDCVLRITGVDAPGSPRAPLDCGNAGTAARLLMGLLAPRSGRWSLDGDASLRGRPMARVSEPLRALGARIDGDRLPLTVEGAPLRGGHLRIEVPSAQVKSALLLAALGAEAPLTVEQPSPTRDHTERMLPAFGIACAVDGPRVTVGPGRPRAATIEVPGDPSAAAFLAVAALLVPGSELDLHGVGLWPRRTGWIEVLRRAGARIEGGSTAGGTDPVGDLRVVASELQALQVAPDDVPDLVDELPILALAAARARGTSRFAGLAELRLKESDRVAAIARTLSALGVPVVIHGDALEITGVEAFTGRPSAGDADHRMALTRTVARHVSGLPPRPAEPAAAVSWPGFERALAALTA